MCFVTLLFRVKLRPMLAVELGFVIVAIIGLLGALRPQVVVRYLLADWQRKRLSGNLHVVSWTSWGIFGCSVFTLIVMVIEDVIRS